MTNQEQYDMLWKSKKYVDDLKEKLDRVEKQRNALIIALNYVSDTMVAMKWGANARPDDMERIVNNALHIATDNSEGTIKLEERR